MNVSWKQSSAASRPTDATRNRQTASRCSSRNRWKGGWLTLVERPARLEREAPATSARHAAQQRRGAVALLAQFVAQRVEDGEHVVGTDRLAPGQGAARLVEPQDHAVVDVLRRSHALGDRERALVDDLADDPSHDQPGGVGDPGRALAERREERLRARGGLVHRARRAGELDERRRLERRENVESGRRAVAALQAVQRASRAQQHGGALARLGPRPAVDGQPRFLAAGVLAHLEAGLRGARAQVGGDAQPSGDRHDAAVAAARRRRLWIVVVVAGVLVPAVAALAPQPPGGDHARAQGRGAPARLAEAELVEGDRDLVADVDAHEVLQLERAHAKAGCADDGVDGLDVGDALLQESQRLEAERPVAAVDQEARAVGGVDDALAHRLAGGARDLQRLVGRLQRGDDLQQLHERRRVEEVHADDAAGVGGRAGDGGDGDRGRVRGQNGPARVLAEPAEDLALEL